VVFRSRCPDKGLAMIRSPHQLTQMMKRYFLVKKTLNKSTFCGEPAQLCNAGRWKIKGLA